MTDKKPYEPPTLRDISAEDVFRAIAGAFDELQRLRERVDELLGANTAIALRRQAIEEAARYVLENIPGYDGIKDRLRFAINACPRCGAISGEPCKTENVGAKLPVQHAERIQQEKP